MAFSAPSIYGVVPQPFYGATSIVSSGVTNTIMVPTTVPVMSNKPVTTQPPQKYFDEKPPVTTVFVGNITERAPDSMIKLLLQKCGNVLSWKRVQGASGKLQAFGFCEYEDPEATLRCIRLLNDWKIGEKHLVVKVDPKTKDFLNEYKRKKRAVQEAKTAGDAESASSKDEEKKSTSASKTVSHTNGEGSDDDDEEDTVDDLTLRDDETIKIGLENILKEYSDNLNTPGEGEKKSDDGKKDSGKNRKLEGPRHLTIEDMDLDNDRKDLINQEIAMFRSMHKDDDDSDHNKRDKERERERERRRRREVERYRGDSGERSLASKRSLDDDRRASSRSKRTRSRSRERDRDSRSKSNRDEQDEIRKRLEREMRKKEEAYKALLSTWEDRERKKQKEYQREEDKKRRYEEERLAEARRLKEFLQDYDDDVLDSKYYKGSALQKRLRDRDIEKAVDDRDRQKELEEVDAMRQKVIEEGDPNAEKLIWQMEQKMEEHLVRRLQLDFNSLPVQPELDDVIKSNHVNDHPVNMDTQSSAKDSVFAVSNDDSINLVQTHQHFSPEQMDTSSTAPPETGAPSAGLLLADYGEDDEEDDPSQYSMMPDPDDHHMEESDISITQPPPTEKPRFINSMESASENDNTLLTSQKSQDNLTAAPNDASKCQPAHLDKKQIMKNIIDQIPTLKEDLFAHPIEWDMVDEPFVTNKIRPWVDKKIASYIGEEEPTLTNFICEQVLNHCNPEKILGDISMVLDEEAEVFVVKMWRLLIYCIKERHAGIDTAAR